jgi:hypothetical protein
LARSPFSVVYASNRYGKYSSLPLRLLVSLALLCCLMDKVELSTHSTRRVLFRQYSLTLNGILPELMHSYNFDFRVWLWSGHAVAVCVRRIDTRLLPSRLVGFAVFRYHPNTTGVATLLRRNLPHHRNGCQHCYPAGAACFNCISPVAAQ